MTTPCPRFGISRAGFPARRGVGIACPNTTITCAALPCGAGRAFFGVSFELAQRFLPIVDRISCGGRSVLRHLTCPPTSTSLLNCGALGVPFGMPLAPRFLGVV